MERLQKMKRVRIIIFKCCYKYENDFIFYTQWLSHMFWKTSSSAVVGSSSNSSSSRNIWVSGLSSNTKAADLKNLFGKYGKVNNVCSWVFFFFGISWSFFFLICLNISQCINAQCRRKMLKFKFVANRFWAPRWLQMLAVPVQSAMAWWRCLPAQRWHGASPTLTVQSSMDSKYMLKG